MPYGVEVVFFILIILQMVELLERVISSLQGLYLDARQHRHRINTYTKHPCLNVGFEPMIPASERAKAVHASDLSATVTGPTKSNGQNYSFFAYAYFLSPNLCLSV
jgi:hypothetical protein